MSARSNFRGDPGHTRGAEGREAGKGQRCGAQSRSPPGAIHLWVPTRAVQGLVAYPPAGPCGGNREPRPRGRGRAGTASEKTALVVVILRIPTWERQEPRRPQLTSIPALYWLRDPLCLSGPRFPHHSEWEQFPTAAQLSLRIKCDHSHGQGEAVGTLQT